MMISLSELRAFHNTDRNLFARLVIVLNKTSAEALLVMATWLWLENRGFYNIIAGMLSVSDHFIDAVFEEAILILNCLQSEGDISALLGHDVSLSLTSLLTQKSLTMQMISQNKFTAIGGIKILLSTICSRIFTDILHLTVAGSRQFPFTVPGFPHPVFGQFRLVNETLGFDNDVSGGIWDWNPDKAVSEDDRTMFLTFSRGFPVTEEEVHELFTEIYGECVERVHMQGNVNSNEQPLFARLVLLSITTVDRILNGRHYAKFRINGKHIWARKYERRGGQ